MSKTIWLSWLMVMVSFALHGQMKPDWTRVSEREVNYPQKNFFTGYIEGNVQQHETVEDAKIRLLQDARGLLSESIRVTVKSRAASHTVSTDERFNAVFTAEVQTATEVEIAGIHSEQPYHDPESGVIHAFVYVSREELAGYHKSNLTMHLTQAEGLLQTARDLEASGEKAKARGQCETAIQLLARVRIAQDLLTAIDINVTSEELQQPRTEALHSRLVQMQAQLAQAVFVYLVSNEYLFDTKVNIVANQPKAELAKSGCSFIDNASKADFKLNINVSTRHANTNNNFVFCYADTQVELYDLHKKKVVYSDEIAQRAGDTSQERAARKAMTEAVKTISEKLKPWIEN